METPDSGATWRTVSGVPVETPLRDPAVAAPLVHDFAREKLLVYLKDLNFDSAGNPIILFVTSKGYASGPANDPRTWRTAHWNGTAWDVRAVATSDNNYDTGCLHVEPRSGRWIIVGPTETGPQPYNTGGRMALWVSADKGLTWRKEGTAAATNECNHSYARRPLNAAPGFFAFWADGHGRKPSPSSLYFLERPANSVRRLPRNMTEDRGEPETVDHLGPSR